jgi:hypothetical protein
MDSNMPLTISEHAEFAHPIRTIQPSKFGFRPEKAGRARTTPRVVHAPRTRSHFTHADTWTQKATRGE